MASVGGGGGGAGKMAVRSGVSAGARPHDKEKKKKESILDLSKYIDKTIRVKFQGGREALLEGGNRAGELNLTFMKSCVAVYLVLVSNHCFVCGLQ
ncbi:U6 snRNA-associated Sm-like protein LSm7 isoform X3 [Aquila chrysaetos chrysaetos]|uniref:U6 snRNA-associated Sm-like protein LSm7 isoform X3 n=1 Tax=Aquila chrysaetos chrysaetos TaxID=223781 RepID=UPI001B7D34C5|nr:U6 snRNA-associated Sm-like protein LSm7 isoform X3 [Aquila chrysaetos chrysaetos]